MKTPSGKNTGASTAATQAPRRTTSPTPGTTVAGVELRAANLEALAANWTLAPRMGAPRRADGFRVDGQDPARWLELLAEQPVGLQALVEFLPLPTGALMTFPAGMAAPRRSNPRLRPYHRMIHQTSRELWIPCDSDLRPELDEARLSTLLFSAEDQWIIVEPDQGGLSWLAGPSATALRPARLLQLPTAPVAAGATGGSFFENGEQPLPPRPLTHPMLVVRRALQHSAEELLERGREDIASSLERVPEETKGWLAKLLDQLILGERLEAEAEGAPGSSGKSGRGFGLGDRLLQMMRAGGEPGQLTNPGALADEPHGKHWLKNGLLSLMNLFSRKTQTPTAGAAAMDAEAMRNFSLRQKLLEWWLERSPRARSELFGEQRNALVQLLDEFGKGYIQEALQHALPLTPINNQNVSRTVGIYDSASLPVNDLNAPLNIDHAQRPAVAWLGGGDLLEELRKNYTQAAQQLIRQKRHHKAAYIYAMLLGDFWQAAHVLTQGGLHREAAQIYLEQLGDMRWAAAEFEAAGDLELAAELYLKLDDFDRAARVYENAGLMENAQNIYRRQADHLLKQSNFLAAGHVHAYKLRDVNRAVETFEAGLRQATGSVASELAVAALRCQLEQGRIEEARALEARVFAGWIDDLRNLTSVQALTHFCGELAILGKDLRADQPLKEEWRSHVLVAASRLAKIHQEAGRPGHMNRVLEPLNRIFHDDPACHNDALRAQHMRMKLRAGKRSGSAAGRDNPVRDFARVAGHAPVTCTAIAAETGMMVCGDYEGGVWLYDPATQKLLQRSGIGAPAVAVSIESGGYYVAVLDAQKHLRIFQTGHTLVELATVSAFTVAGAICLAPQIVRDRIFIGTRFGSILTYRLVDGMETGEPFVLRDNAFRQLFSIADPIRLAAVTDSGLYTVLSYYDNHFHPLDSWHYLPETGPGERRIDAICGAGSTGELFFQLQDPSRTILHYNTELNEDARVIYNPASGPFGAMGCLADGTLVGCLQGAPYILSTRPDQPHRPIAVDMTGMEPKWILPHPQPDRFWMLDVAGNARLAGLPKPPAEVQAKSAESRLPR